jgi:transcriptional regulator with XRE-family HTH domain
MARSSDDRGEAIRWYLYLRVREELDRNVPLREVARRTGIAAPQLSLLINGGSSGGLLSLIRYADKSGRTPGQLLDEALRWWERSGRAYAELAQYQILERKVAPKSNKRRSVPVNR